MADKINLTIVLRKEVADMAEAKALLSAVKVKFADNHLVTVTGSVNTQIKD